MYHSQYGQDKFLDEVIFNKKSGGFFLDIGAHDGISYSNTFFFEKERQFKGICFEPNPFVFEKLQQNRHCKLMNVCIGDEGDTLDFMKVSGYGEMLSGLVDSFDERHLQRIEEGIKNFGGTKEIIKVKSVNLANLPDLKGKVIDYCNIDTEGNEMIILKTIDFSKLNIRVFTIENNYRNPAQQQILFDNGYELFHIAGDEFFIKKEDITIGMRLRKFFYQLKAKFAK